MFTKTFESEIFKGSSVKFRPLTGPHIWNLQRSNMGGEEVYNAFRSCVMEWTDVPLLQEGAFSEAYDPMVIDQIKPGFVIEVVTAALQASSLTEAERKNS